MKINFNKIICINLAAANTLQLFAICETYLIGFEELYKRKTETKVSMYWMVEKYVIAYVIDVFFFMGTDFKSTSKEDQDRLRKMKPIKTPKIPNTDSALNNYKVFLSEGYDIRSKKMDSKLNWLENRTLKEEVPIILDVDVILDKISNKGISSITREEKDFLDKLK